MNIVKIEWGEFQDLVYALAEKIYDHMKTNGRYDFLYGIPRGGLIPAVMLSHKLTIPITQGLTYGSVCGDIKVLIVDDIADSGNTIKKFSAIFDIATVYTRKNTVAKPTFYAKMSEEWIQFPYETSENDPISIVNYER